MRALAAVYASELGKLVSQLRVWVVIGLAALAPWIFVFAIHRQDRLPLETLFGRYLKTSGFATPLVTLGFAAAWALPLITSLICGDVFSSEDTHGTLKTILTRSVGRSAVFAGKVLAAFTYATAAVVVLAASSIAAGVAYVGRQPLITLGGTYVSPGHAFRLAVASWAITLLPVLGFASLAIFFSILTRSSVLGVMLPVVVAFVMQMYAFLNGLDTVRHLLLTTVFMSWHGILDSPAYYDPVWRGALVCVGYTAAALVAGYAIFLRRDVTGG